MGAPRINLRTVNPQTAGWDAIVEDNFAQLQSQWDGPTHIARVYRLSASNPGTGGLRNLADFDPVNYQGHRVWVMDPTNPGGTPSTGFADNVFDVVAGSGSVTNRNQYAFSDGIDWIWESTQTTVTDIS